MRRCIFLLLAAVMMLLCGCGTEQLAYKQISMEEGMNLYAEENCILVDVRTQEEYDTGHIPGAILIPNETIGAEEPAELPDKDALILIYCRSGNRSKQASEKLVQMGYANIVEIGGIIDYNGEIEY